MSCNNYQRERQTDRQTDRQTEEGGREGERVLAFYILDLNNKLFKTK